MNSPSHHLLVRMGSGLPDQLHPQPGRGYSTMDSGFIAILARRHLGVRDRLGLLSAGLERWNGTAPITVRPLGPGRHARSGHARPPERPVRHHSLQGGSNPRLDAQRSSRADPLALQRKPR